MFGSATRAMGGIVTCVAAVFLNARRGWEEETSVPRTKCEGIVRCVGSVLERE